MKYKKDEFYTLEDLRISNERHLDYFERVLNSYQNTLKSIIKHKLTRPNTLNKSIEKEVLHIQKQHPIRLKLKLIIDNITSTRSEIVYENEVDTLKKYLILHKQLTPPFAKMNGLELRLL